MFRSSILIVSLGLVVALSANGLQRGSSDAQQSESEMSKKGINTNNPGGPPLSTFDNFASAATYEIDPAHSVVSFVVRHFVSNVHGRFTNFEGVINYDKQNPAASRVSLTVWAASIDTDNSDRDAHLRSADFFEVEKYPTLTFTSTSVRLGTDFDQLEVTGNLTIKGVTRRITLLVKVLGTMKDPYGEKAGFETSFQIDRKEYNIIWNKVMDPGGAVLGDDVKIHIAIESHRQRR